MAEKEGFGNLEKQTDAVYIINWWWQNSEAFHLAVAVNIQPMPSSVCHVHVARQL